MNELAARHQNYGSLFYNQDGFSGALSSMPTPSNLPRMSTEDEDLMWDILDLTSSSSFPEMPDIADSVSQNEEETVPDRHNSPGTPTLPQGRSIIGDGAPQSVDGEPTTEWPLSSRMSTNPLAAVVPDIPDWMIFGDFTEYL